MAKPPPPPKPTVLITGATSGIGLELARIFAQCGHHLCLAGRTMSPFHDVTREMQAKVPMHPFTCDLAQPDGPRKLFDEVTRSGFHPQILVNNAGFGSYGEFTQLPLEEQLHMVQVNVRALLELTGLFLPWMVEHNVGKILNVASTAAFQPIPTQAVYAATKAFVLSYSEALGNEVRKHGITVTTLCPGPTETGFAKAAKAESAAIFKPGAMMGAAEVALAGVRGLDAGKSVVVPGLMNNLLAFSVRLAPRQLVTALARKRVTGK